MGKQLFLALCVVLMAVAFPFCGVCGADDLRKDFRTKRFEMDGHLLQAIEMVFERVVNGFNYEKCKARSGKDYKCECDPLLLKNGWYIEAKIVKEKYYISVHPGDMYCGDGRVIVQLGGSTYVINGDLEIINVIHEY